MEVLIGAFLQKAVGRTFGISHAFDAFANINDVIEETFQPAQVLPDSPRNPEVDPFRRLFHDAGAKADKYPNTRIGTVSDLGSISDHRRYGSNPVTGHSTLSNADASDTAISGLDRRDQGLQFTKGPARIVPVHEDGESHPALLITRVFMAVYNDVKRVGDELLEKSHSLRVAQSNVTELEAELEVVKSAMDEPNSQFDTQQELEDIQSRLAKFQERQQRLPNEIAPLESKLQESIMQLQGLLEEAFETAPQPELFSEGIDEDQDEGPRYREESICDSIPSGYSEHTRHSLEQSPEELRRREAAKNVRETAWEVMDAQIAFDGRHEDYRRELDEFHRLQGTSEVNYTTTFFDQGDFKHVRGLTQRLREAEDQHEQAKTDAKALNIVVDPETGSVFNQNDGYRESQEANVVANVDRVRIEKWFSTVPSGEDPTAPRDILPFDVDPWEAKPIDITESISMVDFDEYAVSIKHWANHCSVIREEQPQAEADDRWMSQPASLSRRQSI